MPALTKSVTDACFSVDAVSKPALARPVALRLIFLLGNMTEGWLQELYNVADHTDLDLWVARVRARLCGAWVSVSHVADVAVAGTNSDSGSDGATVPPPNIRASASPGMWAGGLPRFAMRYTNWKRPLMA